MAHALHHIRRAIGKIQNNLEEDSRQRNRLRKRRLRNDYTSQWTSARDNRLGSRTIICPQLVTPVAVAFDSQAENSSATASEALEYEELGERCLDSLDGETTVIFCPDSGFTVVTLPGDPEREVGQHSSHSVQVEPGSDDAPDDGEDSSSRVQEAQIGVTTIPETPSGKTSDRPSSAVDSAYQDQRQEGSQSDASTATSTVPFDKDRHIRENQEFDVQAPNTTVRGNGILGCEELPPDYTPSTTPPDSATGSSRSERGASQEASTASASLPPVHTPERSEPPEKQHTKASVAEPTSPTTTSDASSAIMCPEPSPPPDRTLESAPSQPEVVVSSCLVKPIPVPTDSLTQGIVEWQADVPNTPSAEWEKIPPKRPHSLPYLRSEELEVGDSASVLEHKIDRDEAGQEQGEAEGGKRELRIVNGP